MTMSTPIEIVREMQLWRRGEGKYADIREAGAFTAIDKLLDKGGQLSNTVQICCQVSTFKPQREVLKTVLRDWDVALAELADRLKGTQ